MTPFFLGTRWRSRYQKGSLVELGQAIGGYLHWLGVARARSEHTLRAYCGDLAALMKHLGSDTPAGSISSDELMGFLAAQRELGLTAATIRRRASAVRGFCQWLQGTGATVDDPWRSVDVRIRPPKRLPRPAGEESIRRLLASLCRSAQVSRVSIPVGPFARPYEGNTLVAVALMLGTGVRVGEVVSLRCDDVDLRARSARVMGKGALERRVYLTGDWIMGLLQAQLETRLELSVQHPCLLFNRHGNVMTTASLRTRVGKELSLAGIEEHITPHVLRHTAATQLIESGVDIRFVQRLLGHASLTTTEQYTRVSDTSLQRVLTQADTLSRSLAPGSRHDEHTRLLRLT